MRPPRLLALALSALLLLAVAGCRSFDGSFRTIRHGMTREQVADRLGAPDSTYAWRTTIAEMGPHAGAWDVLGEGRPLEVWLWASTDDAGRVLHYVMFGSQEPVDPAHWRVVAKHTWVEGMLY